MSTTKRKRAKDGSYRGGSRPGAGRKPGPRPAPKAEAKVDLPPISDNREYALALLSRTMRDAGQPMELRVQAASVLLGQEGGSGPRAQTEAGADPGPMPL